jgi:putative membrane protein
MVNPNWLKPYLNETEIREIEKDIAQIELKTEAEIVPVIVRSSSAYYQSQVTLMLIAAMIFILFWETFVPHLYWDYWLPATVILAAGLAFTFFVAPRLAQIQGLRRLLTIRSEEMEQCWKRARLEFFENRLHHTDDSVGVLIYVSLLEHVVIVLADKKITEKLPAETWQNVVDQIVIGIKNKQMALGYKKGLQECSNLLIENFPVKSGDVNELPNHVIIKE